MIIFANYILNQEKVNEKANEILKNVKVKDYKGTTMTIGEVFNRKESKLKFVDLWASWCAPCVEAIPYTKELPFRFSSGTIQPFFISTDTDMEAWKNASKRLAILTEVSYVIADEASMKLLEEAVHLNAIPHYLLLDSENKIQVLRAPAARSINQDFLSPFLNKKEEVESIHGGVPPSPPPMMKKKSSIYFMLTRNASFPSSRCLLSGKTSRYFRLCFHGYFMVKYSMNKELKVHKTTIDRIRA